MGFQWVDLYVGSGSKCLLSCWDCIEFLYVWAVCQMVCKIGCVYPVWEDEDGGTYCRVSEFVAADDGMF